MQNYLTIGKVVFVRLAFQNFKDSSRPVISSVNPLDDSENKLKYLISLDKDNLDHQNLKMLLDEYSNGNCEFFFKFYILIMLSKLRVITNLTLIWIF